MGRSIYHRYVHDEVEDDGNHHPGGCMWGLIHVLDFHHWKTHNNLKNMIHHQESIDTHVKVNSNTSLKLDDPYEVEKLLKDKKRSHLLVNQNKNKKSIKDRIKALMAEEFFKKENVKKQKKLAYPPRPQLQRTLSFHYLKFLDDGVNKIRTEDDGDRSINSPQMELPDKPSQSIMGSIKNTESSGKVFINLPSSRDKARLTKSGTFPTPDLSRITTLKPTKLEHKKNEIWFPPRRENLVAYAQVSELALPKYKMKFKTRSWSLDSDNEFIPGDRKSILASQKSKVDPEAMEEKSEGTIDEISSLNDSPDRYSTLLDDESDTYIDLDEATKIESYDNANDSFKTYDSSASYKKDDADLLYVREILERSGFCQDVLHGVSVLSEQPLNTSEFEKMEAYWHECFKEEIYDYSHHRVLNDLIIEVITQIYDRSSKVYLTSSQVHPLPSANWFIDEAYAKISKMLNNMPNRYQTLSDIVSQDLVRDDGWLNLKSDSECVGLELEDIIFDELLEELLCP